MAAYALTAALAAAALCAVWKPLLLQGMVPLDGNMIALSYPNWMLTRTLGRQALLPVWNPWRDMGEPFLADPQTLALYPIMRLLAGMSRFIDFLAAWVVLHTLLAAVFLGALAWRLHKSPAAAAAAAVLAGCNGFFTGRVTFPNHFAAAAWLPAVLYFQQRLSPLGLGASLALQWLAGFPPFAMLSVVTAAAWACAQGRRGIKCFAQGAAWALGLCAAQWIPFMELLGEARRKLVLDPALAQQYSVPPLQLLKEAFLPQWVHWTAAMAGDPAIVCFYVGLAAWGLAAWALWRGGRQEGLLGLGCAAALILSLGGYLPGSGAIPFLRIFRFPANWLLLATTALSLLAASGVARLRSELWKWAAVAALVLDLAAFAQAPRVAWAMPEFLDEPPALAQFFQGDKVLSRIYHTDELRRTWEGGVLESEEDYFLMRDFLAPSFGAAFGVPEASSYQTLRLKKADAYLRRLAQEGPNSQLADWAGVELTVGLQRHAPRVARKDIRLTRRLLARPRVFMAQREAGAARIESYRPGRVAARVEADQAGWAVLAETDYPGWRVFLDGSPVKSALFAGAFPAVMVPAGGHDILFVLQPLSVRVGALISMLTASAFLLVFFFFEKSGAFLQAWRRLMA